VDIRIPAGDEGVSFEGVSQGRCPDCLSIVYKLDVLARLESVLREHAIDDRINAPTAVVAQASNTLATG
jgi:hypothetical protein